MEENSNKDQKKRKAKTKLIKEDPILNAPYVSRIRKGETQNKSIETNKNSKSCRRRLVYEETPEL